MPPRYAYWTILIDQTPTAFRAREREELLPTFHQLGRKNTDVVMKWFARGRLWDSPAEAQAALHAAKAPLEKRGHGWRPGGEHRDPRERFKKRSQPHGATTEPSRDREKPRAPYQSRPQAPKPNSRPPRSDRPWADKPKTGPPRSDRPWAGKPKAGPPPGDRPWASKPKAGPPQGNRPWADKPKAGPPPGDRPWGGGKPFVGRPRGASATPSGPDQFRTKKPFSPRKPFEPRGGNAGRKPWQRDRPTDPRRDAEPPKRTAETPVMPPGPPPSERIRTKPKPPEKG